MFNTRRLLDFCWTNKVYDKAQEKAEKEEAKQREFGLI